MANESARKAAVNMAISRADNGDRKQAVACLMVAGLTKREAELLVFTRWRLNQEAGERSQRWRASIRSTLTQPRLI